MIPAFQNLLNAGSKAMNINGSVTPKSFSYTATQTISVTGFSCVLKDEGSTNLTSFGAISALSNGVLFRTTINGTTTTITNIKDNGDLCSRFHFNQFGNGAVLSILGISTAEGFGGSNNIFIGFMDVKDPRGIILNSDDTIEVVVQDNLSGMDFLQMSIRTAQDQ